MPPPRKRIMREFRIDEISGVDNPAQEGRACRDHETRQQHAHHGPPRPEDGRPAHQRGGRAPAWCHHQARRQRGPALDLRRFLVRRDGKQPPRSPNRTRPRRPVRAGRRCRPYPHDRPGSDGPSGAHARDHEDGQHHRQREGTMPDEQNTDATAGTEPTVAALQKQLDSAPTR